MSSSRASHENDAPEDSEAAAAAAATLAAASDGTDADVPVEVDIASPPKPQVLNQRSLSIITPQSATLANARVVERDESTGEETTVRPLSSADVLCGRGGLVNGYIGNVEYRELVSTKRQEYLDARKRDKADIARAIVKSVLDKGGLFLRRVDDASGKGGKGAAAAGILQPGEYSNDARGSRWIDIGEGKAREKTSQALREGLDVRAKQAGGVTDADAAVATTTTNKKKSNKNSSGKRKSSAKTAPSAPVALPGDSKVHLISFLPVPVANFLMIASGKAQTTIATPEAYAEASATEEGRQLLAQRLYDWKNAMNEPLTSDFWLDSLGTVELWRRQVDLWTDISRYLESQKSSGSLASPSPIKKSRRAEATEECAAV